MRLLAHDRWTYAGVNVGRCQAIIISLFFSALQAGAAPIAQSPTGYITRANLAFQWQGEPGISAYHFRITKSETNELVYESLNHAGTSLALPDKSILRDGIKYTWKVRSNLLNGTFGAWSNFWIFVVYDPLFTPTPQQPRSYVSNAHPDFVWSQVSGAIYYEFEIINNKTQGLVYRATNIPGNSFVLPSDINLNFETIYLWRVRAVDIDGVPSRWADWLSFLIYNQILVPQVIGPVGYVAELSPLFQWSAVSGAEGYEVELIDQSTGALLVRTVVPGTSLRWSVDMNKIYLWRVRTVSGGAVSSWAPWKSFLIYDAGFVPAPSAPQGDVVNLRPEFVWGAVASAATYQIEVRQGTQIAYQGAAVFSKLTLAPGFQFKHRTTYSWRVRAVNALSQVSSWSEPKYFVAFDPAWIPVPRTPKVQVLSVQPTLVWSDVNGAAAYDVETMDHDGKVLFTNKVSNSASSLSTPAELANHTAYKWRVRSAGPDGFTYQWSDPVDFAVYIDVSQSTPSGFTSSMLPDRRTLSFQWGRVVGVDHYVVTFAKEGARSSAFRIKATTNSLNVDSNLVGGAGRYSVTVQGFDSQGTATQNSAPLVVNVTGPSSAGGVSLLKSGK